jgi:WD40 repeat protein
MGTSNYDSADEKSKEEEAKSGKKFLPDINDLHLIWEKEMIMMICSNEKEYMIYDENRPEESNLLRKVQGGHDDDITIMSFSYHLSLVATGCINGEIALYDFEMSKIEGLLYGHTGDITAIQFVEPYPIMLSASMDFTICIWGVRPILAKY